MTELKTCPFCGGQAKFFNHCESDYEVQWYWTVECSECEVEVFSEKGTKEDSAKAWNKRVEFDTETTIINIENLLMF